MSERIQFRDVHPHLGEAGLAALADEMRDKAQDALRIRKVKLAAKSLSFLGNFGHLRHLAIEEIKQGIQHVRQLGQLESLALLRVKQVNLAFLEHLPQLRTLDVAYCSCTSFPSIEKLIQLQRLTVRSVSGLQDLAFLGELATLDYLNISEARGVVAFPDMSRAQSLRHVFLSQLPDLNSLAGLAKAPQLRQVFVQGMPGLEPESVAVFLDHPTLIHLRPCLDLEDSPRNAAAEQVIAIRFGAGTIDRDYPPIE